MCFREGRGSLFSVITSLSCIREGVRSDYLEVFTRFHLYFIHTARSLAWAPKLYPFRVPASIFLDVIFLFLYSPM